MQKISVGPYIPYVILILLVVLAFANSLQNGFVWDDQAFIVENPKINLPLKEIPSVFTTPLWKLAGFPESRQVYYRPIAYIYSVLNYKLWGLNPLGFHLTNIILHLIVTILLYKTGLLIFRLGESPVNNDKLISLIAASIFAVHPVHNESVGRVAIGEVIFGLFIIFTLYLFLREKRYISWITFFLALFSKEAAVMLPFALVLPAIHKRGFKKGITELIPYLALIGIYLILRANIVDTVLGDRLTQPIFTHIFTMAAATLDYIRLLIIPYPLSPFYPARWYTSILEPKVLIAILLLILILLLAFKIRKDKVMLFLLTFPFIMLAPVIWRVNTFPIGHEYTYIADRFLYVPSMLFSIFVSVSVLKLAGNMRKKYMLIGWTWVIVIFTVITIFSTKIWKNNLTLFRRIIAESPNAAFAHINLGLAYYTYGRLNEAIQEYKTVLALKSDFVDAYYNLGNAYYAQRRFGDAVKEYLTALKIKPDDAKVYNNLANAYMSLGLVDNAIIHYQMALILNQYDPTIQYNLGVAYGKKGLIDKAMIAYQNAVRLKPDYSDAHNNLGVVYERKRLLDEAIKEYQIVLKLNPKDEIARTNLNRILQIKK